MAKNRAKLLLDKINEEFNLTTLKEESGKLMKRAPLCDIIKELSKLSQSTDALILQETIRKLNDANK